MSHPSSFGLEQPWRLHPQVAVRPEPFGALLYHFGTRRLSFLKSQTMVDVVRGLADHPDARTACLAAGVTETDLPVYAATLATLARSETIVGRAVSRS